MITQDHFNEIDKLVKTALENPDLLTEWETDFCDDWATKLGEKATDVSISDKQQFIFDRIQTKLEKAGEL